MVYTTIYRNIYDGCYGVTKRTLSEIVMAVSTSIDSYSLNEPTIYRVKIIFMFAEVFVL